jgi:hypothetical protein
MKVTEEMVRKIEAALDNDCTVSNRCRVWLRSLLDKRQQLIEERDETWKAKVTNAFDSGWVVREAQARRETWEAAIEAAAKFVGDTDNPQGNSYRLLLAGKIRALKMPEPTNAPPR